MRLLLLVCLIIVRCSAGGGPIVIKEGDSSAIIIGRNGGHEADVPIVIEEPKTSFKSMFKMLFMG